MHRLADGPPGLRQSTLSWGLEGELFALGFQAIVLDGDNLRHGLNSDLGFSQEDRSEKIRRAAQAGLLLAMAGQIAIVVIISPYGRDRRPVREIAHAVGCEFIGVCRLLP
jgi:adenylylsulfate kinase-like enzyme